MQLNSTSNKNSNLRLIECPRDAMQGWKHLIPTDKKIEYLNSLLRVGFDTIDFGSFVSAKAIPQMADTKEVLKGLVMGNSKSSLLAIIANLRGAAEASTYEQITYLGFPFSISETFQLRNANSTISESLRRVEEIQNICLKTGKKLVVYLSMAFGNPYGDDYNSEVLLKWAGEMVKREIKTLSLADTVGLAKPEQIEMALNTLIPQYPQTEIGVHLHSSPVNRKEKLSAAILSGCKRIDGALKGIGGCPMAAEELVGNMNTEFIISFLEEQNINTGTNKEALLYSLNLADQIFQ